MQVIWCDACSGYWKRAVTIWRGSCFCPLLRILSLNSYLINAINIFLLKWSILECIEIVICEHNTSLAAPGALAHRLQRRTACNTSPPNLSKMADGAWKYVKPYVIEPSDQLLLNKFFDPSTPSLELWALLLTNWTGHEQLFQINFKFWHHFD